jgi:hypothetical protein
MPTPPMLAIVPGPATASAVASARSATVVPRRTAAGQSELRAPQRTLTQRQRTVLFLVDGQRTAEQVHALARQAGAGSQAYAELVALGMIRSPAPARTTEAIESSQLLPSSHSLHGDSRWSQLDADDAQRLDRPLDEARALLLRAVRQAAPVAGTFTLLRLKRAATREALAALLDEVEQRLRKPHRRIIAAQTLRHVRHLLTLPPATQPPPAA